MSKETKVRAFILNKDLEKSFKLPSEKLVKYKNFSFSGGESHYVIEDPVSYLDTTKIIFVTKLRTPKDLIDLSIAVDAFVNIGSGASLHLQIGYIPGGRQDRICVEGEAFSSKVYANTINNIAQWSSILVIDPHSDVSPALLNNIHVVNNYKFVDAAIEALDLDNFVLVSPDAGANKKVLSLAQHLLKTSNHSIEVVRADKNRNLATGEIIETIVYSDDLTGKDCVIVDDICDGGKTFIELAKILKSKGAKNVILIVTHGIFSKGFGIVLEHIDQIVTTNSFADLSNDNGDSVTVIGLTQDFYSK